MNPVNTHDTILAALRSHEGQIASDALAHLEAVLANAKRIHGPRLGAIGDCPRYGQLWSATFSKLCRLEGATPHPDPWCGSVGGEYFLIPEKAQKWAQEWASEQVSDAAAKLAAKVGQLADIQIIGKVEADMFLFRGYRDGKLIEVEQSRILNVSSRGKLFNQWPARMKINGRRASEKEYKLLFPAIV